MLSLAAFGDQVRCWKGAQRRWTEPCHLIRWRLKLSRKAQRRSLISGCASQLHLLCQALEQQGQMLRCCSTRCRAKWIRLWVRSLATSELFLGRARVPSGASAETGRNGDGLQARQKCLYWQKFLYWQKLGGYLRVSSWGPR